MTKVTHKSHYAHVFSQWGASTVKLGPQPTDAQLAVIHAFKRPGGKEALGMAMALRDGGMTATQMTAASALFDGNPTTCRNTIKRFIGAGMFDDAGEKGVARITLTSKGKGWVDRKADAVKAEAKPAKAAKAAKPARKARKAKPVVTEAPAPQPVTEAPQADAPQA